MKNQLLPAAWIVIVLFVAWQIYKRVNVEPATECQAYDRLGNGIGCEGPDLGDL